MMPDYSLKDRFQRCISGCWVGASMGRLTSGRSTEEVAREFGLLSEGPSCSAMIDHWMQHNGKPSDLMERIKLISQTIVDKEDRIRAEDLCSAWLKYLKADQVKRVLQPYEALLLEMAFARIPAGDIGRYCDYSGLNNIACSVIPIGLINACDPECAKVDVEDVGRLYQPNASSGIKWAAVTAAGIAAALGPGATVKSVIEEMYRMNDNDAVLRELDKSFEATSGCKSYEELLLAFDSLYNAVGIPYAMSFAKETVAKALCIFRFVEGDISKAVTYAAGTGRDAGSTAALAAALCGALGKGKGLPDSWVDKADGTEASNLDTFVHYSAERLSDQLLAALTAKARKLRDYSSMVLELAK